MYFKMCSAVLISFFITNPAYAYMDPSTGSMFLQSLLSVLAMMGGGITIFWKNIKALFSKSSQKSNKNSPDTGEQD